MAEKPKTNKYWILVDGALSRFYKKITRTKNVEGESVVKVMESVTITVPQTLEEVPEHSEMTALQHTQHDIAERKYLRIREGMHDSGDLDALVERINSEKVAKGKEPSTVTIFKALPEDKKQAFLEWLDSN